MFEVIVKFLKSLFEAQSVQDNLEAYIVAGNPQNEADIERLERQYNKRRYNLERYY